VASLDREVETAAHASPVWPVIEALMALRGISLLAAVTVVAELGDLARFANAPQLMAYLGLVPSEHWYSAHVPDRVFEIIGVLMPAFSQANPARRMPAQAVNADAGVFSRSGRYWT
jgi:hypothetical protein